MSGAFLIGDRLQSFIRNMIKSKGGKGAVTGVERRDKVDAHAFGDGAGAFCRRSKFVLCPHRPSARAVAREKSPGRR